MRPPNCEPLDPPAEEGEAAEGAATLRQTGHKPGVLVVDDNDMVGIVVQLGLQRDGFDVWLASGGLEAIRLYRQHRERIAVVLLDFHMPGMDGAQTLKALRELNPEVLVCFMSWDAGACEPEAMRQCGAAGVISKPFLLEELANVLRRVTEGLPAGLLPAGSRCQV